MAPEGESQIIIYNIIIKAGKLTSVDIIKVSGIEYKLGSCRMQWMADLAIG